MGVEDKTVDRIYEFIDKVGDNSKAVKVADYMFTIESIRQTNRMIKWTAMMAIATTIMAMATIILAIITFLKP